MPEEKTVKKYITISIDDGSKCDLKLLKLLEKYNLKATFYIPKKFYLKDLSDKGIKLISQTQEIGAHSLSHPRLDSVSIEEQRKEIVDSKSYLENLLDKELAMFSYPNGVYNDKTISLVRQAGYIGARTTNCCYFEAGNPFEMNISLHIYPFPFLKKIKEYSYLFWGRKLLQPLFSRKKYIKKYNLGYDSFFSWFRLAKNMFDYAYENGRIFHIFGHSWEIEKFNMWKDLEGFLKYLPKDESIEYLTNGQLIKKLNLK